MGKKDKKKKNNTSEKKNFLVVCFLGLLASIWLFTFLLIAGIEFTTAQALKKSISENYANLIGNSVAQQVSHDFSQTQAKLNSIAANDSIKKALSDLKNGLALQNKSTLSKEALTNAKLDVKSNLKQLNTLATLFKSSFPNADHLNILPWGHSGTAGIKTLGLPISNNIESLMIAKAGDKNIPMAEAYKHENAWFIAFATPVIVDKQSLGIILLSLNSDYLRKTLDTDTFNQFGKIVLKQSGNKQAIVSFGKSNNTHASTYDIPLSQGQVLVYIDEKFENTNASTFQNIYIIALIIATILSIIVFIIYRQVNQALKQDIEALEHFSSSISGLHKTKIPTLKIKGLSNIAQLLQQNSKSSNGPSGALTARDGEDLSQTLNNIASATTQPTADEGIMVLSDSFGDDLNLDDAAELDLDLDLDLNAQNLSHTPAGSPAPKQSIIADEIFRDYDIRGHADRQLDDEAVFKIGQSIATEALLAGQHKLAIARDGRNSGLRLRDALVKGILATGCDVIDIGVTPTPVLYYATHKLETHAGIMITGSHNAADINGFKIVINGQSLHGQEIKKLAERINNNDFKQGNGSVVEIDVDNEYAEEICLDVIAARPIKVVVDAGNGVGGDLIVKMLQQIDCEVIPLHCEIDGSFPNHAPDPSHKANLTDLISAISQNAADIGIALDGDADRMVAVSSTGQVIAGDKLLAIFANDVVSRNPASSVVFDVKCSRNLSRSITQIGGRPVMWKSGHSNIKAKMQETSAILGGEYTGHYFFKERWYGFDDGIYSALRLIELLTIDDKTLDDRVAEMPASFSTEELMLPVQQDEEKFSIMLALKAQLNTTDGTLTDIDGLRLDFAEGWGLIRASNTSANITARFEANTEEELQRIREYFQQALLTIDSKLQLPAA